MTIDDKITEAMNVLTTLSTAAKEAGEDQLMYSANRAWRELWAARDMRTPAQLHRERTIAAAAVTNG